MTATVIESLDSVEALCATLSQMYAHIEQIAKGTLDRLRRDEPVDDCLDSLDVAVGESAPLQQALAEAVESARSSGKLTPQASATLRETRRILAESGERIHAATREASACLSRLGEQIDDGIQGRKGNRAYRMGDR